MKKFHKTIIFTKTPLKKYFRYSEKFQIYPANLKGMPYSKLQKHFPVILEYVIEEDEIIRAPKDEFGLEDLKTLTASTLTKQDEILNLLTLFTNHLFFRYYDLSGTWGIPILKDDAGEEANTWSSKWNMNMFHWPGLPEQLVIDNFTDIHLQYEPVDLLPFLKYYQHNPNYDYYNNKEITFPNNIFIGIEAYYKLEKPLKDIIDTAISHSTTAVEIRQLKKTLSIISAFTAIETMVNYENRNFEAEKCENCGQLQFKVSKKYRDYLLKYIGHNRNNKKKFSALYSLRSKIVHTGLKLKTENLWTDLPQEEKEQEFLNQMEVILLSKLSIVNWLIINK